MSGEIFGVGAEDNTRGACAPRLRKWSVAIEEQVLVGSYFLASIKICQRFMLSGFRMPRSSQGSFFIFCRTSFSSSALKIKREPPSSTKGPPIKIKPSATSRSINSACSSQKGCSRVPFDKSRFGPAEEIITNAFLITDKPQASVHRVQPRMKAAFVPQSRDYGAPRMSAIRGQRSEVRESRCKPFQVLLSALAPSQPLILSEFFLLNP
jgi:hypothetical protein